MINKFLNISFIFFLLLGIFLISGCDDFNLLEILANDISLVPDKALLQSGDILRFNTIATVSPYSFSVVNGVGQIDSDEGTYTAPLTGSVVISEIHLTDPSNRIAIAEVTIISEALRISPTVVTTVTSGVDVNFTFVGGGVTHLFSITGNGGGSIDPVSGVYTPGPNIGTDYILVEDELGSTSEAVVTLVPAGSLIINPQNVEILKNTSVDLTISGGDGSYSYSPNSTDVFGSYIITPPPPKEILTYSAPNGAGLVEIIISDGSMLSEIAKIYVVEDYLAISPQATETEVGFEIYFSASGGASPYLFTIAPEDDASASINNTTGMFIALAKDNTVLVIVTDSNGNTSTCRVKIKS